MGVSAESLIYSMLEERRATRGYVSDVTNDVKESRLSKGKCCPRCESDSVCRNGKYNGKHTENSKFQMPRKSYKRGVKSDPNVTAKEKKKRGLSKDQISVMVALDRSGI